MAQWVKDPMLSLLLLWLLLWPWFLTWPRNFLNLEGGKKKKKKKKKKELHLGDIDLSKTRRVFLGKESGTYKAVVKVVW